MIFGWVWKLIVWFLSVTKGISPAGLVADGCLLQHRGAFSAAPELCRWYRLWWARYTAAALGCATSGRLEWPGIKLGDSLVLCCGSSFAASSTQVWKWARRGRDEGQAYVVTNFLFLLLRSCCTPDMLEDCCQLCTEGPNSKWWEDMVVAFLHTSVYPQTLHVHLVSRLSEQELGVSGKWGWKAYFFYAQQMNGTTMMGIWSRF